MKATKAYEPPKVVTVDFNTIAAALGPSVSCTGFGGSVSC
jgi:hypothetical protein